MFPYRERGLVWMLSEEAGELSDSLVVGRSTWREKILSREVGLMAEGFM